MGVWVVGWVVDEFDDDALLTQIILHTNNLKNGIKIRSASIA